jgi:hypothetical protein
LPDNLHVLAQVDVYVDVHAHVSGYIHVGVHVYADEDATLEHMSVGTYM